MFMLLCIFVRMGRKLAIDFGLKRTGLAVTDSANIIASALKTVPSEELMSTLKQLVIELDIDTFVLGLPKNLNNTDTHITQNVRMLAEALQQVFPLIKTVLLDERFTSSMALQSMIMAGSTKKQRQQKENIDKISATIILQSYLSQ